MEQVSKEDQKKASAIMHAVEIDSNFKLYSYKVISHEQFVSRTEELIRFFYQSVKKESTNRIPKLK